MQLSRTQSLACKLTLVYKPCAENKPAGSKINCHLNIKVEVAPILQDTVEWASARDHGKDGDSESWSWEHDLWPLWGSEEWIKELHQKQDTHRRIFTMGEVALSKLLFPKFALSFL